MKPLSARDWRDSGPGVVVAPTLTAPDPNAPPRDGKRQDGSRTDRLPIVPVAFAQNTRDEVRQINSDGQIAGALPAQPGMKQQTYIAFQPRYYTRDNKPGGQPQDTADITNAHKAGDSAPVVAFSNDPTPKVGMGVTPPIQSKENGGGRMEGVAGRFGVRRLTPRECERLQGFDDDFTAWGADGNGDRVDISDSARYRMLGNAVAVPVVEWIARRIAEIES